MHLGNGAITPECVLITGAIAGSGCALAALALRQAGPISARKATLAATLTAAVFAAQAINAPVSAFSSTHLLGGVLLAWALGPALGTLAMASVLMLQAVLLGDGSLAALGANIINMGLIPAAAVWLIRRGAEVKHPLGQSALFGTAAAAATMTAALLVCVEVMAFRPLAELASWQSFSALMVSAHLPVAVVEGLATALIVAVAAYAAENRIPALAKNPAVYLAAAAIVLATCGPLVASGLPDGYESAAIRSGWDGQLLADEQPAASAELSSVVLWEHATGSLALPLATVLAGLVIVPACCLPRQADRSK